MNHETKDDFSNTRPELGVGHLKLKMKLKGSCTIKNIDGGDSSCVLWHDNTLFTGNDNGIIKAWNFEGDEVRLVAETKVHDYPVYHIISDTSTNQLLSCSSDMKIIFWTNSNGKLTMVKTLEGVHKDAIRKICLSDDCLYSGDESGEIVVWNRDGVQLTQINVNEEIWDLTVWNNLLFHVRDRGALVNDVRRKDDKVNISIKMSIIGRSPLMVNNKFVCLVEVGGKDIVVHKNESGFPFLGKLSAHSLIINAIIGSGNFLYSGGWDKKIIAWNLDSLSQIDEVQLDHYVNAFELDSSGLKLFASGEAGLVSVIDVK